jgi:hypothetical protein
MDMRFDFEGVTGIIAVCAHVGGPRRVACIAVVSLAWGGVGTWVQVGQTQKCTPPVDYQGACKCESTIVVACKCVARVIIFVVAAPGESLIFRGITRRC